MKSPASLHIAITGEHGSGAEYIARKLAKQLTTFATRGDVMFETNTQIRIFRKNTPVVIEGPDDANYVIDVKFGDPKEVK